MIGAKLVGAWQKATRILTEAPVRLVSSMRTALASEENALKQHIVANIQSGGQHAGKPFVRLSKATLIIRRFRGGGSEKLLGRMASYVRVVRLSPFSTFVGIQGGGGARFAYLLHDGGGPWTRPMSAKQRRFLAAAFRQAGEPFGRGGGGSGVLRIRIPARRFFGDVMDRYAKPLDVVKRFGRAVLKGMGEGWSST